MCERSNKSHKVQLVIEGAYFLLRLIRSRDGVNRVTKFNKKDQSARKSATEE
jgi:hypothetical protein